MRHWIALFESTSDKNIASYKGRPFWCGAFDTRDGHIIETHTYERADDHGFHHSLYFKPVTLDLMAHDEAAFFWVDDRGIQTTWREEAASPEIIAAIASQISL